MIIERKGSPLALLTTTGCRYVLHIGRHDVPKSAHMYLWVKPPRLVTPEHIYEIAERLDLGLETIKTHIRHIMEKLTVSDRTQAAVKAMRQGLV